ncbi:MAG: oligosaccharide flippase family protein [Flavobacteriales bacterium]|nr:oligosaccharide flippase family protein [Flavobacteriales bacterium]
MYKKLFSQTAVYGLSSVIVKVLPFLFTPIISRIFDPAAYSPFVDFYSAAGIISVLLTHGMETTIFRFSNMNFDKAKVLSNAFMSVFTVGIVFLITSLIYKNEMAIAFRAKNHVLFLVWFFWILFFDAISAVLFVKLRLEEKVRKFAIIKIINSVLYFVLVIFFIVIAKNYIPSIYNNDWGVGYTFLSNLIASGLTLFLLLSELKTFQFHLDRKLYKKMIVYAIPIMIAGLAGIINETIDRQFLKYLLPEETADFDIGVYGACYKFATIITLFKTAYLLGIEPFIFAQAKNENPQKKYAVLMQFFVITISVILLFLLTNIYWIKFLFIPNEKYYVGIKIVPFILIGTVFLGIYLNLSIWYKINNKTVYGAIISVVGAIITILINVYFISKYSYFASAIATLLSYFVMMVISYFWGQKQYYVPYDIKKFFIYVGFSIIFGLVNFYVLNQNVISGNVFLVILLIIIYILEKNTIKQYIPKKYHSKLP